MTSPSAIGRSGVCWGHKPPPGHWQANLVKVPAGAAIDRWSEEGAPSSWVARGAGLLAEELGLRAVARLGLLVEGHLVSNHLLSRPLWQPYRTPKQWELQIPRPRNQILPLFLV